MVTMGGANRPLVDPAGSPLSEHAIAKMVNLKSGAGNLLREHVAAIRSSKVAVEFGVYAKKGLKELDHSAEVFRGLQSANKAVLAPNEVVIPLEVPIDVAGEAGGGGSETASKAAAERAKEKQKEVDRLNAELTAKAKHRESEKKEAPSLTEKR